MLLLGIDLESTGLDTNRDRIIEIGAVVWDTDRSKPLYMYNEMIIPPEPICQEITDITGITNEDLKTYGIEAKQAIQVTLLLIERCEAVVAHNGTKFDRPLLQAECQRHLLDFPGKHWIDTMLDIDYPAGIKTRSLTHLAAEHGFINPFAHRAFSDVLTMFKVLSYYDAGDVLKLSLEPSVKLIALVKEPWKDTALPGKKEADKAKARGYRFNGEKKIWEKLVKQSALPEEQNHAEFAVKVVE